MEVLVTHSIFDDAMESLETAIRMLQSREMSDAEEITKEIRKHQDRQRRIRSMFYTNL